MRERFRPDITLRLPLKRVVADGLRGIHRFFDIAGIENAFIPLHVMRPHPSVKIGLELKPN